jgi:hypothetical protein
MMRARARLIPSNPSVVIGIVFPKVGRGGDGKEKLQLLRAQIGDLATGNRFTLLLKISCLGGLIRHVFPLDVLVFSKTYLQNPAFFDFRRDHPS